MVAENVFTVTGREPSTMASCPHCDQPLELIVEERTPVPVQRDDTQTLTHPDVFTCASCGSVLFATVSRELNTEE